MSLIHLKTILNPLHLHTAPILTRNYAKAPATAVGAALKKKKFGKGGPIMEKRILPVETDPQRLVNYCCGSNIYKTGEDVPLLADSEYPEWLWHLRLGGPSTLDEYEPNSKAYWKRVRKLAIRRNLTLKKLKPF